MSNERSVGNIHHSHDVFQPNAAGLRWQMMTSRCRSSDVIKPQTRDDFFATRDFYMYGDYEIQVREYFMF